MGDEKKDSTASEPASRPESIFGNEFGRALDELDARRNHWKRHRSDVEAADAVDLAIVRVVAERDRAKRALQHAVERLLDALRTGCSTGDIFALLGVLGPAWEALQALRDADPTGYTDGSAPFYRSFAWRLDDQDPR